MAILCSSLRTEIQQAAQRADNARRDVDALLREIESGSTDSGLDVRIANLRIFVDSVNQQNGKAGNSLKNSDCTPPEVDQLTQQARSTRNKVSNLRTDLNKAQRLLRENLERLNQQSAPAAVSAAEVVAEEQQAKDEGANTQSPQTPPAVETVSQTTATQAATTNDQQLEGGAPATITTPEVPTKQSSVNVSNSAANEDAGLQDTSASGSSSFTTGDVEIAPEFLKVIVPTANKLSGLASYTYSLSIYVMNPEEYRNLIASQKKTLNSRQLLVQSGGASPGQRNPYFDVDFYIEDLMLESLVGTQEVGNSHNATNLEMRILEPQGITFLQRLKSAAREHAGLTGFGNEFSMTYLLVIRFYGYDVDGNQITSAEIGSRGATDNALVEKFIPFHIAQLTYEITSRATEYHIFATTPQTSIAFSQARASIPFNLGLKGRTIEELLGGSGAVNTILGSDEDPTEEEVDQDNVVQTAGTTLVGSLTSALNTHQQNLVKTGRQNYADKYNIVFEDANGLKDAELAKPGRPDKKQSPTSDATTAANRYLSSKLNYDSKDRTWSVAAGTQIVQLIDLVLRSSSYITGQQTVIIDEKTGAVSAKSPKTDVVQWYRVRCTVEPLRYDRLRSDYQYEITYIISRYKINTPLVQGFPKARFRGTHKLYNYWFTGENTEVLDFKINVNANYLTPINQAGITDPADEIDDPGTFPLKRTYAPPNASQQGGTRNSSIIAAGLADRLYNPVDVAASDLEIIGDPDWIQQSEVFYGSKTKINLNAFMYDGSVNYESGEVLFEIKFNPVNDYDINTGLTPIFRDQEGIPTSAGTLPQGQENIIFQAAKVTNYFRGGAFTQKLNGLSRTFTGAIGNPDREFDFDDEVDATDFTSDLAASPSLVPKGSNTLITVTVPSQQRRLQNNGTTTNTNIDQSLPFRDVRINGTLTRVYGTESALLQYYGDQAVNPKPGSNTIDDDAGDAVLKN